MFVLKSSFLSWCASRSTSPSITNSNTSMTIHYFYTGSSLLQQFNTSMLHHYPWYWFGIKEPSNTSLSCHYFRTVLSIITLYRQLR
jgi:hypothetical protein